ncbi:MAG: SPOR domain-containing protein [Bacteroidales bacterium]|nr:SPOR domain-containing protein [Bacteroidales bacterium]MBQ7018377.1 SPOR domain-containing protein [Bacteroidales bacterium]
MIFDYMGYFSKYRFIVALIIMALSLQGCDWVKGMVGMPTSEDIARMKLELQQQEEARQQEVARAQRIQDSLQMAAQQAQTNEVGGYYVVLGSFKDHRNAEALEKLVKSFGYEPEQILLKNGFMMVAVGGHSTYSGAYRTMEKIGDQDFCPYDMWIYGASQGLHSGN